MVALVREDRATLVGNRVLVDGKSFEAVGRSMPELAGLAWLVVWRSAPNPRFSGGASGVRPIALAALLHRTPDFLGCERGQLVALLQCVPFQAGGHNRQPRKTTNHLQTPDCTAAGVERKRPASISRSALELITHVETPPCGSPRYRPCSSGRWPGLSRRRRSPKSRAYRFVQSLGDQWKARANAVFAAEDAHSGAGQSPSTMGHAHVKTISRLITNTALPGLRYAESVV